MNFKLQLIYEKHTQYEFQVTANLSSVVVKVALYMGQLS
jgi:hypothetical protein